MLTTTQAIFAAFVIQQRTPAGFESLNQQQTALIDVYYNGRLIEASLAEFTAESNSVALLDPKQIISLIDNIKPAARQSIVDALSGEIAAHQDLICPGKQPIPVCHSPELANNIALVFDEYNFRIDLFLNPKVLKTQQPSQRFIPSSSAALSLDNHAAVNLQGSQQEKTNQTSYNWLNYGALAYQNWRINYNTAYAKSQTVSAHWRVNELNAEWDYRQLISRAGFIATRGNSFISDQSMLGVGVSTSLNTLRPGQEGLFANPLIVFLNLPSQVSIFRNQQLLSTAFYPAGQQQINSSAFPDGAYQITLRITNNLGNAREEKRFFVKNKSLPPIDHPTYFTELGYLSAFPGADSDINNTLPQVSHKLLYQLGMERRLTTNWGLFTDLLGSNDNAYLTSGLFWLLPFYRLQIEPDFLLGAKQDYGVGISASASLGRFFLSTNVSKIWTKDETLHSPDVFDPLDESASTANFRLSFALGRTAIGLLGQWSQRVQSDSSYSYGFNTQTRLLRTDSNDLQLNFSLTRGNTDPLLAQLSLIYTLINGKFSNRLSSFSNYDKTNRDEVSAGITENLSWQQQRSRQRGWRAAIELEKRTRQQHIAAELGNNNAYVESHASLAYNGQTPRALYKFSQTQSNLQYNVAASSRFVWVNSLRPYISSERTGQAGAVIYIKSDKPKQAFEVLDNQSPVAIVLTDQATPIPLSGYRVHRLSIRNTSMTFFKYKESQQQVVLYPSNFQYLTWQASQLFALVTQLVDRQGKPLAAARTRDGLDPGITDNEGYVQLELPQNTKTLTFALRNDNVCHVDLPKKHEIHDGVWMLDQIHCQKIGNQ